jgi:soluble lytic murein transglycosylase-like protein
MNVRNKTTGSDGPGSRLLRLHPGSLRWWLAPGLVLTLLGTASPAEAAQATLSPLLSAPPPADTSRVIRLDPRDAAASTSTWELIRESMHRLLEPDTRLLRYVSRYMISTELADKIVEEANAAGIDPELAFRLIRVESQFKARARSPVGALGLTQLMPSTARSLDRSLRTEADILEPRTNLRLGFRYLRNMIDRYGGDVRLALLAYNRGPNAVDRALRQGRDPENGYSRKVLGSGSNRYRGEGVVPRTLAR